MKTIKLELWMVALIALTVSLTSCDYAYDDFADDQDYTEEGGFDDEDFGDEDSGQNDQGGSEEFITLYNIAGEAIVEVQDNGAREPWMEDRAKHQELWGQTLKLIPEDRRAKMTQFEVIDGGGELYGYVVNRTSDLTSWKMGLAIDIAYPNQVFDGDGELTYTLIHEYGHILSLNDEQLDPNTTNCDYNPGEGCAFESSYIDDFVASFWKDILDENEDNGFYEKYQDRFVTEYAATNPAEDFAEVFTAFVTMDNVPSGNQIKDQKVRSLYDYPELVQLRQYMKASDAAMPDLSNMKARKTCGHKHHNHKVSVEQSAN